MDNRKPLQAGLRFTVFQRDNFTCQYCGRRSPEVQLEVDHIKPVALGGTDALENLVTSCSDCNRGKAAIDINQYEFQNELARKGKQGRKTKPESEKKKKFTVCMTDEEHEKLKTMAKSIGLELSPFIAKFINEEFRRMKEEGAITDDD